MAITSTAAKLPERIREHNLTLVAAGVGFYAFLALVPMLIAFVSIYGLVVQPGGRDAPGRGPRRVAAG